MNVSNIQHIRIGNLIELISTKCNNSNAFISGIDISKKFIPTRALVSEIDTSKYLVVRPRHFACNLMHIGRDNLIPIAYNDTDNDLIVSPAYSVFRIKDECKNIIFDEYLYIFFCSSEIDRLVWFYTDSSIRGNLKISRFFDICIPLPPLEEQKKIVTAWKSLRAMKEQNEAMSEPLFALCRSRLQEMKKEYAAVELGPILQRTDIRNYDNTIKDVKGLSVAKKFRDPTAKVDKNNLKSYKIVYPGQMCFVQTTNNEKCFVCCLSDYSHPIVVSSVNEVFFVKDEEKLHPYFLYLNFLRKEFDRYARYHSWGSAREVFNWDALCRVKIPLPPLAVQKALVDIYRCAAEAKRIAEEADRLSREICPALLQHAVRGGN